MDVFSDNASLQFVVVVSSGRGDRHRKSNKEISTAGKGTFPIFIPGPVQLLESCLALTFG